MKTYYVETGIGACLCRSEDEDQARKEALRKVGTYNGVQKVREATENDIAWVRAMGGVVPETQE